MIRVLGVVFCSLACFAAQAQMRVEVDATDAPRSLIETTITIPAEYLPEDGLLTLAYPEWMPGSHGPTGPLVNLAGLEVYADGVKKQWRRDPFNLYLHHCDIGPDTGEVRLRLDYLANAGAGNVQDHHVSSAKLAIIEWSRLLVYPRLPTNDIAVVASIEMPPNWQVGGRLEVDEHIGRRVRFAPVSLTELIDNPMLIGEYYERVDLGEIGGVPHVIDIFADSREAAQMNEETQKKYKRVVEECLAMFGRFQYDKYDFLVTLTDVIGFTGLEHHECSLNGMPERALLDSGMRRRYAFLLPHEYVHSWNGRHRCPEPMVIDDFQQPMDTSLLWVYEGLTNYLGNVINARSGLWSEKDWLEYLAFWGAWSEHRTGRQWRNLEDTAIASQILYHSPGRWASWRRAADYYREGDLIWLEADVLIRTETNGEKSLDDFAALFFGAPHDGPVPSIVPYTEQDVYDALSQVLDHDWQTFFRDRVESTSPRAPLEGLSRGGYDLVYTDKANAWSDDNDLRFGIGMSVGGSGVINDVIPGKAAFDAGFGPGMKILAVGERRFSMRRLRDAIKAASEGDGTIDLLIENGDYLKPMSIEYRLGLRQPHLERRDATEDLVLTIARPRVPQEEPEPDTKDESETEADSDSED